MGATCCTVSWWPNLGRWAKQRTRATRATTQLATQANISEKRQEFQTRLETEQAARKNAILRLRQLKHDNQGECAEAKSLATTIKRASNRMKLCEQALSRLTEIEQSMADSETLAASAQFMTDLEGDIGKLLKSAESPEQISTNAFETHRLSGQLSKTTDRGLAAVARALESDDADDALVDDILGSEELMQPRSTLTASTVELHGPCVAFDRSLSSTPVSAKPEAATFARMLETSIQSSRE